MLLPVSVNLFSRRFLNGALQEGWAWISLGAGGVQKPHQGKVMLGLWQPLNGTSTFAGSRTKPTLHNLPTNQEVYFILFLKSGVSCFHQTVTTNKDKHRSLWRTSYPGHEDKLEAHTASK